MIKKLLFLGFFLLVYVGGPVLAEQTNWTERRLGKIILKADKAARKKKWTRAIKYGERMLDGSAVLDLPSDARYINLLKNTNKYYDGGGRLNEVAPRVAKTYRLASRYLGPGHETTTTSRRLYYKLLISAKQYEGAIALVLENISLAEKEELRLLHYLEQIGTLYGLTKQFKKEEDVLLRLMGIYEKLFGRDDREYRGIVLVLAQNYCRQEEPEKFKKLISLYHLRYFCQ